MTTWDAARLASLRPLKKPIKFHEPVGSPVNNAVADNDRVCRPCGHVWCSCKWEDPRTYGVTSGGIRIKFNPYMSRSKAYWKGRGFAEVECGLLRENELALLKRLVLPEQPCIVEL